MNDRNDAEQREVMNESTTRFVFYSTPEGIVYGLNEVISNSEGNLLWLPAEIELEQEEYDNFRFFMELQKLSPVELKALVGYIPDILDLYLLSQLYFSKKKEFPILDYVSIETGEVIKIRQLPTRYFDEIRRNRLKLLANKMQPQNSFEKLLIEIFSKSSIINKEDIERIKIILYPFEQSDWERGKSIEQSVGKLMKILQGTEVGTFAQVLDIFKNNAAVHAAFVKYRTSLLLYRQQMIQKGLRGSNLLVTIPIELEETTINQASSYKIYTGEVSSEYELSPYYGLISNLANGIDEQYSNITILLNDIPPVEWNRLVFKHYIYSGIDYHFRDLSHNDKIKMMNKVMSKISDLDMFHIIEYFNKAAKGKTLTNSIIALLGFKYDFTNVNNLPFLRE